MKCRLCGDDVEHEEYHPELCCDHFDLSYGKPLRQVNLRREKQGQKRLEPYPGRDAQGNQIK